MDKKDLVDYLKDLVLKVENDEAGINSINTTIDSGKAMRIDIEFMIFNTDHIPWWELKKFGGYR